MRRAYADAPTGQLHYREEGSGHPVLFLHKTPSSSIQFVRAAPFIAREGFRVIAMDTPGFGSSDPPPAEQPGMSGYGAAVHALLDALAIEQTHIVGHHTGASIALEAVSQRPERFEKVVFAGILCFETDEERERMRPYLASYLFELDSRGEFLEIYPKRPLRNWLTEDDPEQYWLETVAYLQAGPRYWWAYNAVLEHRAYELLPRLRNPTLFLNQELGRTHESTIRAQKATPGGEYAFLPGTSEGAMDDPEAFARAVAAFLKK